MELSDIEKHAHIGEKLFTTVDSEMVSLQPLVVGERE